MTAISDASSRFSPEEDALLQEAGQALDDGHIDSALAAYRQVIELDGEGAFQARFGQAVCHVRRRAWEDAERELLDISRRAPELAIVRAYLGAVRLELGQLNEARDDLDAAVKLAPGNAVVRLKRGEFLLRFGLLQPALDELQLAAKFTAPDQATRDYTRSLLLHTKKQLRNAAVRDLPNPATLIRSLGNWARALRTPASPSSPTVIPVTKQAKAREEVA